MNNDLYKTLIAISGTDLARLAIPKPPHINKILYSGTLATQLQIITKKPNMVIPAQKAVLAGLAPQLTAIAKAIEEKYKPQIAVFQSIAHKLQPLIIQQTKFAQDLSKIISQVSPALEMIKTLSFYNSFQRYQETFKEFGGDFDPENITEDEIVQTLEENQGIIGEINEIVIQAEQDSISPGDTPAIIYSFLLKRISTLSKKTYGIIVLIFCTVVLCYQLYSAYSTNKTLDETVVPKLEEQTEKLDNLSNVHKETQEEVFGISKNIKETQTKLESTNTAIDDLMEKLESFKDETNDKLELILEEMRKQQDSKNE